MNSARPDPRIERGMRAQPPLWVGAGDEIRFELEPVGKLSVGFTR